jgi:hypothetical protein
LRREVGKMKVNITDHGNPWGKPGNDNHWYVFACGKCSTSVFHGTKECPTFKEALEWEEDEKDK